MTTIEDTLLTRYGALMNVAQLAECLHRSPDSIRISLHRPGEWSEKINATRIRIGRRVYFRTAQVAQLLAG